MQDANQPEFELGDSHSFSFSADNGQQGILNNPDRLVHTAVIKYNTER